MTDETIFATALEKADPAERAAFLAEACGDDPERRQRLEGLLMAHARAADFLERPPVAAIDPNHAATQAQTGTPDPGVAAAQTTGGANGASDDEALTFLAPPTRPDALGRIGHYEVLQVLGRGGFGIVFRAFDETLQRVVALKVMAPQLAATSPARKRFLREARSSAQVRHENVVQVYEVAEQPLPYLAMEFIPGETLQQRLDRVGPVEPAEVVRIGRQIAEGLAAAHATDLIHRDIKPGNVLLEGGHQKVKITDFGLARTADDASISQSGIIAGTPMYMAPEQALGQTLDQRADLFSLGSVLYQMVSGRPPFRANTAVAVLKRVAEDKPRAIREIIPETPQWLCDIIAKLHAKDPDERYQSAREVADVLADCEAQLKANAKLKDFSRIPQGKPAARAGGRWKWAAAAALLLPVLGLALTEITGATHLLRDRETTHDPRQGVNRPKDNRPPPQHQQPTVAPLKPGDPEYTNTLGMKFKLIPAGKFTVGSSQEEIDRCLKQFGEDAWVKEHVPTEGPEHPVEITQPFYMGATDVTVGQFRQFVDEEGYQVGDARWRNPGFDQTDKNPVVWVSWQNAVDFCKWLSAKEGKEYRLPTEAEWEYCCRAGKAGSRYCFGDDETQLENYAWYSKNSGGGTHPVGKKKPNDWGLYDMHGNVWQCCHDNYDPDYYKNSPVKDPPGPGAGGERMYRGGAWDSPPVACRSAFRQHGDPGRRPQVGFRVLLVSPSGGVPTVSGAKDKPPPPAIAPFTDADVKRVADLAPVQQVEEVRKELKRRNPGFDGRMETKIEGGVVTELRIVTDHVTDIAPIRVWSALRVLDCSGTWTDKPNGLLADLTPLEGMNLAALTSLNLANTKVGDAGLVHFKDCKALTHLNLGGTKVSDAGLACFKDCKDLTILYLSGTPVSDAGLSSFKDCKGLTVLILESTRVGDAGLAEFKGIPLRALNVNDTGITDLTPLQGMPLEHIFLTPKHITRGLDVLRNMKSLKTIGIAWPQSWPAAEFWKRYDKGEFKE